MRNHLLALMRPVGLAVVAYLLFGVAGLGAFALFVAAATIAAIAFAPTPDEAAAVIGAIEATYPKSNVARIVHQLNRPEQDRERFPMAKVFGILEMLEDEGTVESFTTEGEDHPAREGLAPRPKLFWRVVRSRPRRKPRGEARTATFPSGMPAPA